MSTLSLADLARNWLEEREAEKPSPHTQAARQADLAALGKLVADTLGRPQTDVASDDVWPFERELGRLEANDLTPEGFRKAFAVFVRGHAAASVRRLLSTWRGFSRWLAVSGHVATDPTLGVKGPKRPDARPKALEITELEGVIGAASSTDEGARRPWVERDRALVAVFAGAGLRIGEVITMRVGDLEAAERSPRLRVAGKGGRRRVVPVGPEVVALLRAYLASREQRFGSARPTHPMFVRADGRAFSRGTLDYLVSRWFRRAGVAPPPGSLAHALRHTYATLLVDMGASLPEVQQLLGHRSLQSTEVYLGVTGRGLEDAALSNPARRLLSPEPPPD